MMAPERDVIEVIDRIINAIPPGRTGLVARLVSVQQTASFTAPEAMRNVWAMLTGVLAAELPTPPAEPWHDRVGKIVRGEAN